MSLPKKKKRTVASKLKDTGFTEQEWLALLGPLLLIMRYRKIKSMEISLDDIVVSLKIFMDGKEKPIVV